jgi:hypothetical protein
MLALASSPSPAPPPPQPPSWSALVGHFPPIAAKLKALLESDDPAKFTELQTTWRILRAMLSSDDIDYSQSFLRAEFKASRIWYTRSREVEQARQLRVISGETQQLGVLLNDIARLRLSIQDLETEQRRTNAEFEGKCHDSHNSTFVELRSTVARLDDQTFRQIDHQLDVMRKFSRHFAHLHTFVRSRNPHASGDPPNPDTGFALFHTAAANLINEELFYVASKYGDTEDDYSF